MPKRQPLFVIGPSIAYIPLTRGQFACVDSEDAAQLAQWNWCAYWAPTANCYYAMRGENKPRRCSVRMHAHLLGVSGLKITADHVRPGNGLDNRRANLRIASRTLQANNRRVGKNSQSGYKGVCWHRQHAKWQAYVYVNRRQIRLGSFTTKEEAVSVREAYDAARI